MRFTDNLNRPYVLVSEVKEGNILIADDGFISDSSYGGPSCFYDPIGEEYYCIAPWSKCLVKVYDGDLYVSCCAGMHYLDGQYDHREGYEACYLGFYKEEEYFPKEGTV